MGDFFDSIWNGIANSFVPGVGGAVDTSAVANDENSWPEHTVDWIENAASDGASAVKNAAQNVLPSVGEVWATLIVLIVLLFLIAYILHEVA